MTDTPATTFFRTVLANQRAVLEQTQDMLEEMESGQFSMTAATEQQADLYRSLQEQTLEASRNSVEASLDAFEAMAPDETGPQLEQRAMIAERFDDIEKAHAENWDAFETALSETLDAYDDLSDTQQDQFASMLDELLTMHQQTEEQMIDMIAALERSMTEAAESA